MRILIISDTHGFVDPRIVTMAGTCEITVHAGDILDPAVLDELRPHSGELVAVKGNNDVPEKWPRSGHRLLQQLPEQHMLDLPGGRLAVEHGHQIWDTRNYHFRLRRRHPGVRAIVYGHSHHQVCDTAENPWVLNPGAAGRVRNHGGPSCLVLHAGKRRWRVDEHRFPEPR
ncbi:MAG: metallophosphatase family protein [Gammaproteobacteria bacterium]|nr:metallophosphatase family protein [Gammaproteobacteria bacterium]